MKRHRAIVIATIAPLIVGGCAAGIEGRATPAINISASLPFTPTIVERVNGRNDGSTFEPCNAYQPGELVPIGIDPTSVSDAGFSESPNFRGCDWYSPDRKTTFGQILGDETSLSSYKQKHSYRAWQPERTVNGRQVAIAPDYSDGCIAAFMSEGAIVVSIVGVTTARKPSPGLQEECDKAFSFASLATSKAP